MKHEGSHEHLTVGEFFEEYWVLFFFGLFFMMTMFVPLLLLDNRNWLYWGIVITLGIAMSLLVFPALFGKKHSSKE